MKQVKKLLVQGNTYLENHDYTHAEKFFRDVLKIDSTCVEAYLKLSECYRRKDLYSTAIALLSDASQMTSDDYRIYKNLADCYIHKGESLAAAQYYQKAFSLNPANVYLLCEIATSLHHINRFTDSAYYLAKYLTYQPEDPDAYYTQGENYYHMREYSSALKYYLRAKSIDLSNDDIINLCLGKTYYMLGDYDASIESLNASWDFQLSTNHFDLSEETLYLALCYISTTNNSMLETLYNQYIDVNVENLLLAFLGLGNAFMDIKDWHRAIHWYEKAIEHSPDELAAYEFISQCYRNLGEIDKGMEVCLLAVSHNSHNAGAYHNLARFCITIKQYDKAMEALNHAIALESDYMCYYIDKAKVFFQQGCYCDAIKVLEEAIAIDLSNDEPHTNFWDDDLIIFLYSDCNFELGNYQNALALLLRGMEERIATADNKYEGGIANENPILYEKLCRVYFELTMYPECLKAAEKLLWIDHKNILGMLYKTLIIYKQGKSDLARHFLQNIKQVFLKEFNESVEHNRHFVELV